MKGIAPAEAHLDDAQRTEVWKRIDALYPKYATDDRFGQGYTAALGDVLNQLRPLWGENPTTARERDD